MITARRPSGTMRRSVILGVFTLVALVMTCVTPDFQLTDNHEVSAASSLLLAGNVYAADKPADQPKEKAAAESAKEPAPSSFWIVNVLRNNVAVTLFITLALGYYIGSIKLGHFSLGAVTGTLLVGVLIGQLGISISPEVKSVFFTMFLFAVGYSVGPQFVRGVAHDGAPQAVFAVVICALCLITTYIAAKVAGFDVGLAAGLWAGAQTISASIGLATDAINNSGISNPQEQLNQIPVAYAICYLWGTIGTGIILSQFGPKLLGVDLPKACKDYEKRMSEGQPPGGMGSAWHQIEIRAFTIAAEGQLVGKTVADAETLHATERLFVERLRSNGEIVDFDGSTVLKSGDVVAVSGPTEALIALEQHATEVADKELLNIPVESIDLVLTHKDINGRTLVDLAKEKYARGVYLRKLTRGAANASIPILAQTTVHRGDILTISGTKTHISRIEKAIGYADRPSSATDMVWVGLFIFLFGLIGAITVKVGTVPVTLSVSGGVLIGGLILGWLRSVHPTFGQLPAPTAWFMNSVGLNVFIAIVGISAGPGFVAGLKSAGVGLFLCGVVATSVPMLLAPFIGKYLFKFDPAINLGCCGGARTSTASVAMVSDVAKSNIPMLGYTVPYAVSNTLLTLIGMIIVLIY
jgi:putative transport protein